MTEQIRRMRREALERIHDANLLSRNSLKASDSDAIIRILGFEILLKAAVSLATGHSARSHDYWDIWLLLPADERETILMRAKQEMPGHADFSDLEKLFSSWRFVFEKARYYYEMLEGYSLEESKEIGKLWEELGAPTEEAMVQYYPSELECMIVAVDENLERHLT